ncbi:hypothetical protein GQS52_17120 [Streptomyces sp. SCUT-3]|uniref:LpqB family beta-propeller domain-containing protein n=1 Tax=Streptomyces TaxID=1883 RepID=UPI0015FBEEB1|nr:LpqB family beta-propeller domain-containing protein [Streptomyces sp. SCUT-3]QMV23207.1 hypothetical protein GQS52_17120 [Streptomyces sp. SCUT-3]
MDAEHLRHARGTGAGPGGGPGAGSHAGPPRGRARPARRRGVRAAVAAVALSLLAAGCAAMPSSGEVKAVEDDRRADADSQVQVFGVKPQGGESPEALVRGFLEATTSDEAEYDTAKEYLSPDALKQWNPYAGVTVLAGGPVARAVPGRSGTGEGGGQRVRVEVSGSRVAHVDRKHAYSPAGEEYEGAFQLSRNDDGEWRIDRLPDGLLLGESDFQRLYRSVNIYYYASPADGRGDASDGRDVLVADPVYLRARIDPVTETVQALLEGPTAWLDPVADSAIPQGTSLRSDGPLAPDDEGELRVRLSGRIGRSGRAECERMAAQVLHTVQEQPSAKLGKVVLADDKDAEVCSLSRDQAAVYDPASIAGTAARQYYIDADSRLRSLAVGEDRSAPVPGPLGDGRVKLGSVAVARDEESAAGVTHDGRQLYVTGLDTGADLGEPLLVSGAAKAEDGLSAPSWDGQGDLWIADRDPRDPGLLVLRGDKKIEVAVPELDGGRIQALRVSADGVRIAMLVLRDGRTGLQVGRVERSEGEGGPRITVAGLRPVAPQMEDVTAVSWAGSSRMVVVGRESQGVQRLSYVDTDGSASSPPTLPGISGVTAVAASEDEAKPLLADSEDGIFRLTPGADWKAVAAEGSSPVYPG